MTDEDLGSPVERYSIWYAYSTDTCVGTRYEDEVAAMRQESMDADYVVEGGKSLPIVISISITHKPFASPTVVLASVQRVWVLRNSGQRESTIRSWH